MIGQIKKRIAPRLAVTMMFIFAVFCGCEKKPSSPAPVSRAKDPAYREQLETLRQQQNQVAVRASKVSQALDKLYAKAKAKLGEKATLEQIEAELAAHPELYIGYEALRARAAENAAAAKRKLEEARATVRDRILKERADRVAATQKQ